VPIRVTAVQTILFFSDFSFKKSLKNAKNWITMCKEGALVAVYRGENRHFIFRGVWILGASFK